MHLQFILRGLPEQLMVWKKMAESQFFKWRRKDLEGNDATVLLQAGLRESVLGTYEYIFPKESLSTVLAMMGKIRPDDIGCQNTIGRRFKLSCLRRMTGTKKIPLKYYKEAAKIPTSIELGDSERGLGNLCYGKVGLHIIGIKEDKVGKMIKPETGEGWVQELV